MLWGQGHLQDVGQAKVHAIPEELLHASPTGRAFLDPNQVPLASRSQACPVNHSTEIRLRRRHLGE
jgi:hypothetical protein